MNSVELKNLIGEYWCLAYAEGMDGRTHDTEAGDAQRVLHAIESAIDSLTAERDAAVADSNRIDWLNSKREDCGSEFNDIQSGWFICGDFLSIRDAIDAAMKEQEQGK